MNDQPAHQDAEPLHINATDRQRGRPFRKGQGGRKKGARNKISALCEALLAENAEAIIRQTVAKALAGNVTAQVALCRLLIGPPKERAEPMKFKLPALREPKDALCAIDAIVAGLGTGKLDADQAKILTSLVAEWRATHSAVDVDERLARLEQIGGQK